MPETVADVMTRAVRTAFPGTSFKRLVNLVVSEMVAAIPIVDDGRHLLGIVSEADLLVKEGREYALHSRHDPFGLLHRADKRRCVGRTASEVMTAPVITASPATPVREAARTMLKRSVKHLPVVDDAGRLIGIVSRGDLLRTFARPDQDIRLDVQHELWHGSGFGPRIHVAVDEGVVTLAGKLEWHRDIEAAIAVAEGVDGVVAVESYLTFEQDERELILPSSVWV